MLKCKNRFIVILQNKIKIEIKQHDLQVIVG